LELAYVLAEYWKKPWLFRTAKSLIMICEKKLNTTARKIHEEQGDVGQLYSLHLANPDGK
jgi:hypothetical protein